MLVKKVLIFFPAVERKGSPRINLVTDAKLFRFGTHSKCLGKAREPACIHLGKRIRIRRWFCLQIV